MPYPASEEQTESTDCPGLLSFDGSTWKQYLDGECVNDVAVGPDGVVWAASCDWADMNGSERSSSYRGPGAALYRISP